MNGKRKKSVKFKNGLLKIPKILSWMISLLGLYFSWFSVRSGTLTVEWYIIVTIIIGNSIFLIACSLYEGFLYKKYTSQMVLLRSEHVRDSERIEAMHKVEIEKSDKKIEELSNEHTQSLQEIDELKRLNETIISTFLEITDRYNYYSLKVQAINDSYVNKVKRLAQVNRKITDCDNELTEIKKSYDNEYFREVFVAYKELMGECTQKLKVVLDNYLQTKNIGLGVSIAIKQLNKVVTDISEITDVRVMTAFRDNETYVQGKREVGKEEYTIYKNTDFVYCLQNSAYINNDLLNEASYDNQNTNYNNYYTCTTVVPIVWKYNNVVRFYGYLTCDAYDPERKYSDIMDKNVAYMMNSVASLLARYFDDIQYSVQNMVYKNFFSELYKAHVGGKK